MTLQHKLWLAIGSCGFISLLCATVLILQSTHVIDITHYFPSLHPDEAPQQSGSPTTDETGSPTGEGVGEGNTATAENGATAEEDSNGKGSSPKRTGKGHASAKGAEDDTTTVPDEPRDLGPIGTIIRTKDGSPTGNPGSIRTTVIKLNDSAMEWTQPGHYPRIGDRISIALPPDNQRFIIEVVYFEERPDGSGLVLYGKLPELGASVIMMTVGNKLNLRINDVAHQRIYYVSLIAGSDEYVVEEWDATKQPKSTPYGEEHLAPDKKDSDSENS